MMLDSQWVYTLDMALFGASCLLVLLVPAVCSFVNMRRMKRSRLLKTFIQATQTYLFSSKESERLQAYQAISYHLTHYTEYLLSLWLDASCNFIPEFKLNPEEMKTLYKGFALDIYLFDWLNKGVSKSKQELALRLAMIQPNALSFEQQEVLSHLADAKESRIGLLAMKALLLHDYTTYLPKAIDALMAREDWLLPHATSFILPFEAHSREACHLSDYLCQQFLHHPLRTSTLKPLLLLRKVESSFKLRTLSVLLNTRGTHAYTGGYSDALYQEALQQLSYATYTSEHTLNEMSSQKEAPAMDAQVRVDMPRFSESAGDLLHSA
jgi:hypothetical protein